MATYQKYDPLHRYTDLPALLYMLQRQRLTFLDPQSWEDKNDSNFMSLYKKGKNAKCLLALCFSLAPETFHHWKVFANGSAGVRVTFDKQQILDELDKYEGFRCGKVRYKKIVEIGKTTPKIDELPFLKRAPYRHEEEFRAIFESTTFAQKPVYVDLPLTIIKEIGLSPWMNDSLVSPVRNTIRSISGCSGLKINHSTLISNDKWKKYGNNALGIKLSSSEVAPPKKPTE